MQAILTRILPATNHRPTRIKAECARGSLIVSGYPGILEEAHIVAAKELRDLFIAQDYPDNKTWRHTFITGQLKSGDYVHIFNV